MAEKPILFNPAMVRAVLAGRKTQTRRVVKYIPALGESQDWCHRYLSHGLRDIIGDCASFCPFGVPGDRLWVKEKIHRDEGCARYSADLSVTPADAWPWKRDVLPSIHCPRGLSRITLEITNVRIERLNEISEEDAIAEGCEVVQYGEHRMDARNVFRTLWTELSTIKTSWDANPWVWCINFKGSSNEIRSYT